MKLGSLAIITEKFDFHSWNCWQTDTNIFTGTERPIPVRCIQNYNKEVYIGQLCQVINCNYWSDIGHVYVYIYALNAYTDVYTSMLVIVLE